MSNPLKTLKANFDAFGAKYNPKKAPDMAKDALDELKDGSANIAQLAMSMEIALIMQIVDDKMSPAKLEAFINDLYDIALGDDMAKSLNGVVHGGGITKMTEKLDAQLARLEDPATAKMVSIALAEGSKFGLVEKATQGLQAAVNSNSQIPPMAKMLIAASLNSANSFANKAQDMDPEEIEAVLKATSKMAPSKMINDYIIGATAMVDKKMITGLLGQARAKLPNPAGISEIYAGLMTEAATKIQGRMPGKKGKGGPDFGA